MSSYQLLVTGRHFTGHGFRAVEPVIEEILSSAQGELIVVAYVVTESATGLLSQIEQAVERGVRAIFILNRPWTLSQVIKERLLNLRARFQHVEIYAFDDAEGGELHAKVIIADRSKAVIGSANLSWGGLVANHEIGVLVEGEPVWALAAAMDRLASNLQVWNP